MNKKALVIDGNSLCYRAFYATLNQADYYKKNNYPVVNALKLVLLILLKLLHEQSYDYALVAFDHEKKTNRHNLFTDYKAGRKPMPEDLVNQLPLIKNAIKILGISVISIQGIEADDIIGSFCKKMNSQSIDVEVYTSDRDLLQLVNEHTAINIFQTGISMIKKITLENFRDNFFGLEPDQVCDFKAIAGDNSDNLGGVKGIGPKTAAMLIKRFGSIDKIYASLDQLAPSQSQKFITHKEHAYLCKTLCIIQLDAIDHVDMHQLQKLDIDSFRLEQIIRKYHFKGMDKYLIKEQMTFFN
ncbi:MAG: 5'-3' exonuclease [Mycoplasmataceae bacterium]|jgi:DNA polymerase-1|nr:5'-3' exonuclease [Mycoplasmataceae bacterium]